MFSNRVEGDLKSNRLALAVQRRRASGLPIVDLTESNPTRVGLNYPHDLLAPLADPRGLVYAPHPLGLMDARRAVAGEYARRGIAVDADHVVLTTSTSEAYSLLFKVLAAPGDEILVPRPSYPLFDHLTRLDGVAARRYDLEYHGRWSIDMSSVEREMTRATRALLIVSPNNPTGSFVTTGELDRLTAVCRDRDVALIADEVFADYVLDAEAGAVGGSALANGQALAFALGGLSKSAGLPQVKLGWIAVGGPAAPVAAALERLEVACDTYLSVSTPVQLAAADLIARGQGIRTQIAARIRANHRRLRDSVASHPSCTLLHAAGGWYAILQVPTLRSEEDLVVDLVEHAGILIHPGYFFDFARESYLVLSLLPSEESFADGVTRLLARVAR